MHDRNGKLLSVGDWICLHGKITECSPGDDFCNCEIESIYGRRPDGAKEKIGGINTGVLTKVDEKGFLFDLNQKVKLKLSGESGVVIARMEHIDCEHQYSVRYKAGDGRQVEFWWYESALEPILVGEEAAKEE